MGALPEYLITVAGELPLRSARTRPRFYRALIENIRDAVNRASARVLESEVVEAKVFIVTDKDVISRVAKVFGVYRVGRVLRYNFRDLGDLAKWAYENTKDIVIGKKFAVRVKRSGFHSFTSLDVAREVGALLKPLSAGVDLEKPDITVELEIRGSTAYLYRESLKGPGGLPTGIEGRALALFSGGFDSPVAAWMAAKRGIQVDFLHFVMGSQKPSYYAFLVAKYLASEWLYGYKPKFIVVDLRDVVVEVSKKVDWSFRQVVLRALMYVASSKMALLGGYDAVVTGESVGQASSQTLKNLSAIERAVKPQVPILRPLMGLDKEEIIELSRRVGLYELSSKVAEACAIAPRRVSTSSEPEDVLHQLDRINMTILDNALSSAKVVSVLEGFPEELLPADEIEVDFVPEGALIIDARSGNERREKPIPGAIPLEQLDPSKAPRNRVVVVVCETGQVSYILAKMLREQGIKAFSLKGGVRGCPLK